MKTSIENNLILQKYDIRLDASYYLSDGVHSTEMVKKAPAINFLKEVVEDVFNGPRFKRCYVKDIDKGVPFMGGASMCDIDLSKLKVISKKNTVKLNELMLKSNWTLITRSGTIGKVCFTNSSYEGKAASEDIIRVIANQSKIGAGYLHAFLSSSFGYSLLTQGTYGAVIQHIEPHHILDLPVPRINPKKEGKINRMILDSSLLRSEADNLLAEVKRIFDSELIFEKVYKNIFRPSTCLESSLNKRLESTYFINQELCKKSIEKNKYKTIKIKDVVTTKPFNSSRGKRIYVKDGMKFLSTSDVSQLSTLHVKKFLSHNTQGLDSMIVKKDWILIASSGQEILGDSFIVDGCYSGCAVNQHSIRLCVDDKKICPNYLYGFLSSNFARRYMRAGLHGSAVLTLAPEYVEEVLIPFLELKKMKKVSSLVKKFREKHEAANYLEFEAISLLEKEINSWQK